MEINSLLDELYSYSMHGIKLGLDNIKSLCVALGNPQNDYKIIHIAGTNGKGSTATTIESILIENGNKVGKYTSPHILKFNERIRANGVDISDYDIVKYFKLIKEKIELLGIKPTFFEVTTAMMFKYFSDLKLEYVVLETGMGGRFDATNVADDSICVITNVSLDHTEYLGDSLYKISKEKAGIIKKCKNVVVASSETEFLKAILEENVIPVNVIEKYKECRWKLDFKNFITNIELEGENYEFSLFGDYQVNNFLTAYEVAKILKIDKEIIKKAVRKVKWQCRFEKYMDTPLVILDGAHNLDGITQLVNIIKKEYDSSQVTVITSILKDKEVTKMLTKLKEISTNIILTSLSDNPRGLSGDDIYKRIIDKEGIEIENDINKAFLRAKNISREVIIVCGSFYTLSKFKEEVNE